MVVVSSNHVCGEVLLETILCDKVCQCLATGLWFSVSTPVSSPMKTDRYDINEILLKVTLNTLNMTHFSL
jgi:hypothetical protein